MLKLSNAAVNFVVSLCDIQLSPQKTSGICTSPSLKHQATDSFIRGSCISDGMHSSRMSPLVYFLFWGYFHCSSSCILLFKVVCRNGDICTIDTKIRWWKSHPRHSTCPHSCYFPACQMYLNSGKDCFLSTAWTSVSLVKLLLLWENIVFLLLPFSS